MPPQSVSRSVQLLSHVQFFVTPWIAAMPGLPGGGVCWSLLKLMSIASVMPSNHHILYFLLLLLFLIFPSIRVFSNDSALHIRWPKYWSCSFSISPSKEHSWLIAFRTDWFDHLAIQGTLKSLLQHYSLKASIFQCSAFFYGPTLTSLHVAGKTIVLPIWTFVSKVMYLLFNPDKDM